MNERWGSGTRHAKDRAVTGEQGEADAIVAGSPGWPVADSVGKGAASQIGQAVMAEFTSPRRESMAGRILIIEDEEIIQTLIEEALSDEGYDVVVAEHGAAALALLEKWTPDVILLDMWMRVMQGWQFVQAYRQASGNRAPIIVMSAVVDAGDHPVEIEADRFLAKPLDLDELLDLIGQFTRPGRAPSGIVH